MMIRLRSRKLSWAAVHDRRSEMGLDGAEAVLTLRAVTSNDDWEEYWRFHLTREHRRLCRGAKQGQCTLGA